MRQGKEHIAKEGEDMKFLKVEENKGYYTIDKEHWNLIDQINRDHLLELLDYALSDDFEMDEFDKDKIGNQAHQIIYKHIYEKLKELNDNKSRFKDESETLYMDAIEKYSQ